MILTLLRSDRRWLGLALAVVMVAALTVMRLVPFDVIAGSPQRAAFLLLIQFGAFALIWAPGLLISDLPLFRAFSEPARVGVAIVASGLLGWIVLWSWFASPAWGRAVSIVLLVATVAGLAVRGLPTRATGVAKPFLVSVLVAVFYLAVAGDHGGSEQGGVAIAHRYWVSVDNVIPMLFARALVRGRSLLLTDFLPGTQASERPPLQTGMLMPEYWLTQSPSREMVYVCLGLAVNAVWVAALWAFLRTLGVKEGHVAVAVVAVAVTGAVFLNTIYTWPKMLAAAYVLVAAVFVLDRRFPAAFAAPLAAMAAALALLSHGGAVFGLLGLIVLVIVAVRRWRPKWTLIGAATAVVVYLPWVAFQQFFDPPGDRLIKWHAAGAGIVTPTTESPLAAVLRRYSEAGPLGTLENKLNNVAAITGFPTLWNQLVAVKSQPAWSHDSLGFLRQLQSSSVVPALGVLVIGLLVLLIPRVRRRQPWVRTLLPIVGIMALAYALMEFGDPRDAYAWLHQGPYALLLLAAAAGALGILALPRAASIAVLALHLATFIGLWIVTISTEGAFDPSAAGPIDRGMLALEILSGLGIGAFVLVALRGRSSGDDDLTEISGSPRAR